MEVTWIGSDSYPIVYSSEQRDQAVLLSQEAEQPFHPTFSILLVPSLVIRNSQVPPRRLFWLYWWPTHMESIQPAKHLSCPEALVFLLGLAGSNVNICLGPQRLGCKKM